MALESDITERKQAEEALRANEERWLFALEEAKMAFGIGMLLQVQCFIPHNGKQCWGTLMMK